MKNLINKKSIKEEIRAVKKQTLKVLGFGFLVILFFKFIGSILKRVY
ncbi:hypothetical protein ACH0B6_18740 [Solibacillus silvestris]